MKELCLKAGMYKMEQNVCGLQVLPAIMVLFIYWFYFLHNT
jgi:hypothetical protein